MSRDAGPGTRFRLSRAGVLNVWQYDEQVFEFGEGRLLLRGSNGAGKSKTLELLLPFCIDGDRQRMNATGRAQTALTWLMLDGVEDRLRTGYVWVEFERRDERGQPAFLTCGVGLRASRSASSVTTWMFCTPQRVGIDLALEDADGPVSAASLKAVLAAEGRVFDVARDYRAHVGHTLFGLDPGRYDDLLRLLYWLRQPQIGEEIDPKRIAAQLAQSLPELDADQLASAGSTLDELADFGEKLRRTRAAETAAAAALAIYGRYARAVAQESGRRLTDAEQETRRLARAVRHQDRELERIGAEIASLERDRDEAQSSLVASRAEAELLTSSPEETRLDDARALADAAAAAAELQQTAVEQANRARERTRAAAASTDRHAVDVATRLDAEADFVATRVRRADIALPQRFSAPGSAAAVVVDKTDPIAAAAQWTTNQGTALESLAESIGVRAAAVTELRGRVAAHGRLRDAADVASRSADAAAARADELRVAERTRRDEAATAAQEWSDALSAWASEPAAVPVDAVTSLLLVDVDDLLEDGEDLAAIDSLAARVAAATEDRLRSLQTAERDLQLARISAAQEADLTRASLEHARAETDPTPPPPVLPRDRDHGQVTGAPLWRAVDFVEGVDASTQASIEAALQQSGLLDAWVDADGQLRGTSYDVFATPTPPVDGPTLGDLLRPAADHARIEGLLASIGVGATAAAVPGESAAIGLDGSFRLGPLEGRARKDTAQYVGAAARAAERARRIAELSARLAEQERGHDELVRAESSASADLAAMQSWTSTVPSARSLLRSRDRLEDARRRLVDGETQARLADEAAAAARTRASQALAELRSEAERFRLPTAAPALETLQFDLRELEGAVTRHRGSLAALSSRVAEATEARTALDEAEAEAGRAMEMLRDATDAVVARRRAYESLRAALSETIAELQARRDRVRQESRAAQTRLDDLGPRIVAAGERLAVARERRARADEDAERHALLLADAAVALCRLRDVPGLLPAALGTIDDHVDRVLASGASEGAQDVAPELVAVASSWSALGADSSASDTNAVLHMHSELATGPAAAHEPTLSAVHDVYAITARDGSTRLTLAELAHVLTERVAEQSELLTSRERDAFERVLLGALGDELRRRLLEAHELVASMNELLLSIRTSQGIQVRLRWRIRDDTPPEARDVTELVARSPSALLPDERDRLHRAMGLLLSLAADDAPDDGYAEHLRRALDYRTWHEFRVQYIRPGTDTWLDLSRRSPLSQGEQKVACYLPLFAAAAAHFTSVAGAAPHAPRFVLLDDAFPKIDARTHPLLFGLLVSLDLDFIVTSERLWGDHAEVPALEVYEALRNPAEPGIAHARYSWDGRALHAVSAS